MTSWRDVVSAGRSTRVLVAGVVVLVVFFGVGGVLVGFSGFGGETEQSEDFGGIEFDAEPLELEVPDPTVQGTADVDAGTQLQVVIESNSSVEDGPFYAPETTTAGEGGEFIAEYEITALAPGTEVLVSIYGENEELLDTANVTITVSWTDVERGERLVEFDDELLELDAPNDTVSGTADVDPGTELGVSLSTESGADNPFFIQEETTVDETGVFEVEFDLTGVESSGKAQVGITAKEQIPMTDFVDASVEVTERADENDDESVKNRSVRDIVDLDDEEPLWFDSGNNTLSGVVDGSADIDELLIELREAGSGGPGGSIDGKTTSVDDGEFTVAFDTSEVKPETEVIVTITHPELAEVGSFEGVVLDDGDR